MASIFTCGNLRQQEKEIKWSQTTGGKARSNNQSIVRVEQGSVKNTTKIREQNDDAESFADSFVVTFEKGPLGMGFKCPNDYTNQKDREHYSCIVKEVVKNGKMKGQASQYNDKMETLNMIERCIQPGLRILKINDESLHGIAYPEVLARIQNASRPITIMFGELNNTETLSSQEIVTYSKLNDILKSYSDMKIEKEQLVQQLFIEKEKQKSCKSASMTLLHEKDILAHQLEELKLEYQDINSHSQKLHEKLTNTQKEKRDLLEKIETMSKIRLNSADGFATLHSQLGQNMGGDSELSKILLQGEKIENKTKKSHSMGYSFSSENACKNNEELTLLAQQRDAAVREYNLLHQKWKSDQDERMKLSQSIHDLQAVNETLLNDITHLRKHQEACDKVEPVGLASDSDENVWIQHQLKDRIQELEVQLHEERQASQDLQAQVINMKKLILEKQAFEARSARALKVFKSIMTSGIIVRMPGRYGRMNRRIVYTDESCKWLSWKKTGAAAKSGALMPPSKAKTFHFNRLIEASVSNKSSSSYSMALVFNSGSIQVLSFEITSKDKADALLDGFQAILHQRIVLQLQHPSDN